LLPGLQIHLEQLDTLAELDGLICHLNAIESIPDSELAAVLRQRERTRKLREMPFVGVVSLLQNELLVYAQRRLLNFQDAEDVVQEVFLMLWIYPDRHRPGKDLLKAWIYKSLKFLILNRWRQKKRTVSFSTLFSNDDGTQSTLNDEALANLSKTLQLPAQTDAYELLLVMQQILTPEQFSVLYLLYFVGLTQMEIARSIKITRYEEQKLEQKALEI
jgi:RNA polymerase sigma factor (sigma-70 family)